MMDKTFFVMMYNQKGTLAMPLTVGISDDTSDEEEVAFFATEKLARKTADDHYFASNFGYEVFNMEEGL